MKTTIIPIDSEVFGRTVLSIDEFSATEDFAEFESAYIRQHDPVYASCKIPLERLTDIHILENHGFHFIECQIKSSIDLQEDIDTSTYPYRFERVTTEATLESVLDIAGTTFIHDRFSMDPAVDRRISGERYRRYVQRSFAAEDEAVYRLFDPVRDETVAFKTHRYLHNNEVLFLLGGVHPRLNRLGLGVINTYSEFSELRRLGFRVGYTHISAVNHHVFNVEIAKMRFRVIATYAVMRKIYA